MFSAAAAERPERAFIHYLGRTLSFSEVDRLSDAFAAALADKGFGQGDRLALYLQNVPQFPIAMLAAWKVGGIVVCVSPMLKQRELVDLLVDSGSTVLVAHESLFADVANAVTEGTSVRIVVTTSELDFVSGDQPAILAGVERLDISGSFDLLRLCDDFQGRSPPEVVVTPDEVAFLVYTSGTTGPSKGAMNTHANVVFASSIYREFAYLDESDVVLGLAPLSHVTGVVACLGVAMRVGIPLVLGYRFDPNLVLETIERYSATFTVASITVFVALLNEPTAGDRDLSSLRKAYCGGAPIAPATAASFTKMFGVNVHPVYGLTETTSPSHLVPLGAPPRVDALTGALSVGLPVSDTVARVVDDEGTDLPVRSLGEIVVEGPQVVPGYWNKPRESASAIREGRLFTGDIGFMDAEGWFYVVDRKKDLINASGYKIWPKEVEDVLYEHPDVIEAAVVGAPDPYRVETVVAFVALRADASANPKQLIEFCRSRMAAYKYPRFVQILPELPKTASGKILRRDLRTLAQTSRVETRSEASSVD